MHSSFRFRRKGRVALAGDQEREALAFLVQKHRTGGFADLRDDLSTFTDELAGFARDDLFVCVHEQVMTETAAMADIVLPATMFVEHDDIYKGGGHQYMLYGPKLIEAPGEARENDFVQKEIARRVGAEHPGFAMTPREHIAWMLDASGFDTEAFFRDGQLDCQPPFEEAHYRNGFGYPDGRFRFAPDWASVPSLNAGPMGPVATMPKFPDQWDVIELASDAEPALICVNVRRIARVPLEVFPVPG